jgi:hypothetical protein
MLARRDGGLRTSDGRDLDTLLQVRRGDPPASTPTDDGRIIPIPGDFREIQNTLWFHDHRISFTSETSTRCRPRGSSTSAGPIAATSGLSATPPPTR